MEPLDAFPDFDAMADFAAMGEALGKTYFNSTWRQDGCPSFMLEGEYFDARVFVDYRDPAFRECVAGNQSLRFHVTVESHETTNDSYDLSFETVEDAARVALAFAACETVADFADLKRAETLLRVAMDAGNAPPLMDGWNYAAHEWSDWQPAQRAPIACAYVETLHKESGK